MFKNGREFQKGVIKRYSGSEEDRIKRVERLRSELDFLMEKKNDYLKFGDLSENADYTTVLDDIAKVSLELNLLSRNPYRIPKDLLERYNSTGIAVPYSVIELEISEGGSNKSYTKMLIPFIMNEYDPDVLCVDAPIYHLVLGGEEGKNFVYNKTVYTLKGVY